MTDSDSKVADMLRKSRKPVVLAVNKVDNPAKFGNDVYEFYNLGSGDPVAVSYTHLESAMLESTKRKIILIKQH